MTVKTLHTITIQDREFLKLTKEKLETRDHRGSLVDFVFCRNCVTFITIEGKKEGDEIICFKCRTDENIIK